MKHPIRLTAVITAWLIAACAFGAWIIPRVEANSNPILQSMNMWLFIPIATAFVLAGAFLWVMMMKNFKPKYVDYVFVFGLGMLTARFIRVMFPAIEYIYAALIGMVFIGIYITVLTAMQNSWEWTIKLTPVSNIVMATGTAFAGAMLGTKVTPWIAIVFLIAISIYDAWAVWKSGTMVEMAQFFIDRRIIPGLARPYKNKEGKFALLGGGDVFFIVFVGAAFYTYGLSAMIVMMAAMVSSIIYLYLISKEDTFYPALPFILAGAAVGITILLISSNVVIL